VTVAGRASESLDWLLSANTSRSDALKNMGTNGSANVTRTTPNPETDRQSSVLGKLVFSPGGGQKHVFTFEHVDKEAAYNLLSNVSVPPLVAASVLASSGDTTMKRDRLTWDGRWQLNAAVVDELRAIVSFQDARSNEYFFQDRNTLADRSRNTNYRERSLQANLQASKLLRAGDTAHKFAYGLDYTSTKVRNVQTGMTPAAGETYPLKRFPDTTESSTALYAQDEFIAGAWSITPGVRMDHFSIDASQAGYTPVAKSMSGSAVSPKLGAIYRFTPQWSAYGNFAAGFKAPTAGQVNGFFSNPLANYQSIANPNLKAEKSRSVEIGVRGRTDGVSLDVAAFTGRYKDFIEEFQQVGGAFTPTNPAIYQAINLSNVTISGFEIKGRVNWGKAGGGTLSSPFAYGQTRGRNTDNNRPLNSVAPQRLSTGLQYEAPTWSLGFNVNHYAAKKLSDVDTTATPNPFLSKAETLIDVSGQWRVQKDLRITAGIYNLTDRKYWRWSDVVGQSATSTTIDAYTQPGRYARVSLVKDF
jgi:hemoglobin/transferrin/lactoferrin receptor protein